jgi:hypothetical protein
MPHQQHYRRKPQSKRRRCLDREKNQVHGLLLPLPRRKQSAMIKGPQIRQHSL